MRPLDPNDDITGRRSMCVVVSSAACNKDPLGSHRILSTAARDGDTRRRPPNSDDYVYLNTVSPLYMTSGWGAPVGRLLSGNSAVPDRWRPFHFLSYTTCKITAVNNTEQYSSPSSNPFCQLYIPVHISFKEIVASVQCHCHIGIFHVINTTSSSFVQNSYSAPTQRIAWLCQGCRRLACSVVCSCR